MTMFFGLAFALCASTFYLEGQGLKNGADKMGPDIKSSSSNIPGQDSSNLDSKPDSTRMLNSKKDISPTPELEKSDTPTPSRPKTKSYFLRDRDNVDEIKSDIKTKEEVHKKTDASAKEKSSFDRDRKDGRDRNKNDFDFGLKIGFTENDFYLPAQERITILYPAVETVPEARIFVEKLRIVDPACIFPEDGFYTFLIPIDSVFGKAVIGVDDKEKLCDLMLHYIVAEPIVFDELEDRAEFTTLAGDTIIITKEGTDFLIDNVKIVKPQAFKERGVIIHVIEGELK